MDSSTRVLGLQLRNIFLECKKDPFKLNLGEVSTLLANYFLGNEQLATSLFQRDCEVFMKEVQSCLSADEVIKLFHKKVVQEAKYEEDCFFLPQIYQVIINAKRKDVRGSLTLEKCLEILYGSIKLPNQKPRRINCQTSVTLLLSFYTELLRTKKANLIYKIQPVVSLSHSWVCVNEGEHVTHYNISDPQESCEKIVIPAHLLESGNLEILSNGRFTPVRDQNTLKVEPLSFFQYAGMMCENFLRILIERCKFERTKPLFVMETVYWVIALLEFEKEGLDLDILKSCNFWMFLGDLFTVPALQFTEFFEARNLLTKNLQSLSPFHKLVGGVHECAEKCFEKSLEINKNHSEARVRFVKTHMTQFLEGKHSIQSMLTEIDETLKVLRKEKSELDSNGKNLMGEGHATEISLSLEVKEIELERCRTLVCAKAIITQSSNRQSFIQPFLDTLWKFAVFPDNTELNLDLKYPINPYVLERQRGDAGFINENVKLLREVLELIKSEEVEKYRLYLGGHRYLTELLVQGDVVDLKRQEWAKRTLPSTHKCSRYLFPLPKKENENQQNANEEEEEDERSHPSIQNVFVCSTCMLDNHRAGICENCATLCHRSLGHQVIIIGKKTNFFCDCGTEHYHTYCGYFINQTSHPSSTHSNSHSNSSSSSNSTTKTEVQRRVEDFYFLEDKITLKCVNPPEYYNHNFDALPQYCYEKCVFDHSDNEQLEQLIQLEDGQRSFNGSFLFQCVQCEDWYHPCCSFTTLKEIDEQNIPDFICNCCYDENDENEEGDGDGSENENEHEIEHDDEGESSTKKVKFNE